MLGQTSFNNIAPNLNQLNAFEHAADAIELTSASAGDPLVHFLNKQVVELIKLSLYNVCM